MNSKVREKKALITVLFLFVVFLGITLTTSFLSGRIPLVYIAKELIILFDHEPAECREKWQQADHEIELSH